MTRRSTLTVMAGALLGLGLIVSPMAQAQENGQQYTSREEVNAAFAEKFADLERQQIDALAKVAAKEEGAAADATYRLLFNLAIARNLYPAAEKAAETVIEQDQAGSDILTLAHFVNIVAEADRGEFEESLTNLKAYVDKYTPREEAEVDERLGSQTVLALGEAYFQRLVEAGRYDVARQLCEYVIEKAVNPAVKDHFSERLGRVHMLGQPAPAISAKDIDGRQVQLSDYEGKVVLVDFWATWCPPCSPQMFRLNALREQFKEHGFEVLGVNVDGLREGAGDLDQVRSVVRRYLIDHGVAWPNVLNGEGLDDATRSFGVKEIPANFLIGRDGKIIGFELGEDNMAGAIAEALGLEKPN